MVPLPSISTLFPYTTLFRSSRLDRWGRYRVDENRRRRIFARHQSGSGFFWRGPGHRNENQSERDGSAAQEHAVYKRGEDRKSHTSELQSLTNLVCRLLLEKK